MSEGKICKMDLSRKSGSKVDRQTLVVRAKIKLLDRLNSGLLKTSTLDLY